MIRRNYGQMSAADIPEGGIEKTGRGLRIYETTGTEESTDDQGNKTTAAKVTVWEIDVDDHEVAKRDATAYLAWLKAQYTDQLAKAVRAKRDALLKEYVDTINAVRWSGMTDDEKSAWTAYRKALLDVPEQEEFPESITWPVKPE